MKWLKMRTCHSSGRSRWEYKPLYVEKMNEDIEDWVEEIVRDENDDHNWSEHYRGVEYFIINTRQVPNNHIEKTFDNIIRAIDYHKESVKENEENLLIIKKLKGKGRKTDPDEIEAAKRKKRFEASMAKIRKEREKKKEA